jgi:hypothetical protein
MLPSCANPSSARLDRLPASRFCEAALGDFARGVPTPNSDAEGTSDDAVLGAYRACTMVMADVARGRVAFDDRRAASCALAMRRDAAAYRQGPLPGEESCAGIFVGQVEQGGACAFGIECRPGLACAPSSDDGTVSANPRVCRPIAEAAENCSFPTRFELAVEPARTGCPPDRICMINVPSHIPRLPNRCAPASRGGLCTSDWECPGARCHRRRCGHDAPAAAGGACLDDSDCRRGLSCKGARGEVADDALVMLPGACE